MLARLKEYVATQKLFETTDRILLAVSGGIDSMVMLNLFVELKVDISLAHCNFSLRGCESDADEALVAETAQKLGLELFTKRFEPTKYASSQGVSLQMAARELHYAWFNALCREQGFKAVAVAHNANDNAETLLINLTRGAGIKGLSGIRPKNQSVIRPLLFALRSEIEGYAAEHGVAFRTDASNADTKYTRNYMRHMVIPNLQGINPSVVETINQASQHLASAWELVSEQLAAFRLGACKAMGDELHYSIAHLMAYPHRSLFLAEELIPLGFSPHVVNSIEKAITGQSGKIFNSPSHQIIKDREALILTQRSAQRAAHTKIFIDDSLVLSIINLSVERVYINGNYSIPSDPTCAALDANRLTFPLTLRRCKPGDWFIPLGMKGRKKISDFFIDSKVPVHKKRNTLIVESDGAVAWVVGHRIDNRFKITPGTKEVLLLRALETSD